MSPRPTSATAAYACLLACTMVVGVATTEAGHWTPVWLLGLLVALAIASDLLALRVRGLHLSGAFATIVLAMALLGPLPAVVVALAPIALAAVRSRPAPGLLVSNLATYAAFPLVGGLVLGALDLERLSDAPFALAVFAVFLATNALNFVLIYAALVADAGRSWRSGFRELFLPVLPAQLAIGLLTVAVLSAAHRMGPETIAVLAPLLVVFQWLLRTAIAAFERGEALEERNRQLASLHLGLIGTLLKTLSLRDHMTARHSAAVARYSREIAAALGLPEREQEIIHTAALFHDIGKFIFPDSILLSDRRISDEEYEIVKRHPEVGADVIGEIEGYEEVAHIVRHHHERIDGLGYPARLVGDDIPLGARIISVADIYDVITARDTYRTPVTVAEAFAELRRVAGTQLDAHVVETFIDVAQRKSLAFRHASEADFEAELALERRVSDYAAPRVRAVA